MIVHSVLHGYNVNVKAPCECAGGGAPVLHLLLHLYACQDSYQTFVVDFGLPVVKYTGVLF